MAFCSVQFSHVVNKIPPLSYRRIESRAENALAWFDSRLLQSPRATPIDELVARLDAAGYLVACFDIPLGRSARGNKILGEFLLKPFPTIFIDPQLQRGGPRFRFTLAHELGHFTFHRNLALDFDELDTPRIRDTRHDLYLGRRNRTDRDWLEWQANAFASAILLPSRTLVRALVNKQQELGIRRPGRIFVDDQWHNRKDHKALLVHLQETFEVSRTTLVIRLKTLGLLEDRRVRFQPLPTFALRQVDRSAA